MKKDLSKFWFNISDKIRFLIVGVFNFFVSYCIYSVLVYTLGEKFYQPSLALSWVISSVVSFTTQRTLVFPVKGNILKQYLKCCTTWFFSYLINAFLLWFIVEQLKINVYLGQILAVSACAVFNYVMFKIFAFKK
mgnify:CR=1 FL=1